MLSGGRRGKEGSGSKAHDGCWKCSLPDAFHLESSVPSDLPKKHTWTGGSDERDGVPTEVRS
jgi:hypothetical protein